MPASVIVLPQVILAGDPLNLCRTSLMEFFPKTSAGCQHELYAYVTILRPLCNPNGTVQILTTVRVIVSGRANRVSVGQLDI